MRSHEKIKKIKNRVKNRRKKFFTLEDARAGVERQSVLPPGCDFSFAVFDSVFNFYIFFVTPHDHVPNKTQNNNKIKIR